MLFLRRQTVANTLYSSQKTPSCSGGCQNTKSLPYSVTPSRLPAITTSISRYNSPLCSHLYLIKKTTTYHNLPMSYSCSEALYNINRYSCFWNSDLMDCFNYYVLLETMYLSYLGRLANSYIMITKLKILGVVWSITYKTIKSLFKYIYLLSYS